ncbi:uncharacterized protein LOC119068126 [Bradysia coprophila]|uniref:uncharacterized protein LOC119068126 n=1 Tax=Bradysia coprophila TaxID=38358 RepID=UPI00187D8FF9|nr:uncharacterized protein LOC119068126 [Bradysia coprophila]XP_037027480.1 uncharacterized protein LOC119068126 [Bradysia coprophila]
MSSVVKCNKLEIFPLDDGYICSMNVDIRDECVASLKQRLLQTVIILDRSGSMGQSVHRVVNEMLPIFFKRLHYSPDDIIHLITFDSVCELLTQRVDDFGKLPINCRGCTNMTLAVHKFQELFSTLDMNIPVRVLTISDGDVDSQVATKRAGDNLAKFISDFQVPINSQAMRLFTSENQPDTTALCSMLQINNTIATRLLDASAYSLSEYITPLVELFSSDGFSNGLSIMAEKPVFLNLPWENEGLNRLIVRTGQNVFWMKNTIPNDVRIEGEAVNVILEPTLTHAKFYSLLTHKMPFIVDNMKILRVLGTDKATETAKVILEYFNKAEDSFAIEKEEPTDNAMNLKARVRKMIASRRKTFSNLLASIANDDNISKLNSAQKADYLRQVDMSQNSRGLARRAVKEGLNFDEIARNEVLAMAQHFHKIADIDDTNHEISFFSQDTTLGGIKTLVELSQDDHFQTFSVHEIIEILNLVGVACSGPIGDYPDPSTWKVKEIFLGCNVSLSDILVAYNQSNGESLRVPAIDKEITNVIPVFDDARIGHFLKKYAPSLLEYTFSIGMRRIIADVPMTIGYTMCAGIWKMFYELNKSRTSLHLEIFKKFITTFDNFVGRYFDHINPLLRDQKCENRMFYLANNGIPNMMSPLIRIYKENDAEKLKLVPAILRSLYSFEVWHAIRRLYKKSEDADLTCHNILYKLLGIDMSKKVKVMPPFVDEPRDIKFYDEANQINYEYLDELAKPIFFVNYLTLIPKYLKMIITDSDSVKDIATLSRRTILEALDVEYEYKEFVLFNVFQALRFSTRALREDTDSEEMKIADPKDHDECMEEIKSYIRKQYEQDYVQQLQEKSKIENERMGDHIASKILGAETYDEVISIWRNGLIRNNVTYKISTPSSAGFKTLLHDLFRKKVVPQRINIVKCLLLGVDDKDEAVWNHGGVCFSINLIDMKANFVKFGSWEEWNAIMVEYKKKGKHIYREHKNNQHGHGNDKPSFWAMGYSTMVEFRDTVSLSEFKKYCKNHRQCCGVRNLEDDFLKSLDDDT